MPEIQLLQGDCLELMRDIPDHSIDMILCDLPYGTSSCRWDSVLPFDKLWEQYRRIIKPNRVIALFGCEPFSTTLRASNIKNYKYDWIWDKHSVNGFLNAKKRPMKRYENIMIFSYGCPVYYPIMVQRGKPRDKGNHVHPTEGDAVYGAYNGVKTHNNTYYPTDIIDQFTNAKRTGKVHPTQKPVPLLEYLIRTYVQGGETVLDNTMGSGSTGVACVNTGRSFIGMELDAGYFEIAKQRIAEAQERVEQEQAQLRIGAM